MKKFFTLFALITISSITYISCSKKSSDDSSAPRSMATCADRIQNEGETGIDCGGPCQACVGTYFMKYTMLGSVISADTISALRDSSGGNQFLTIFATDSVTTNPYLQIKLMKSSIGWVDGINAHISSNSYPDNVVNLTLNGEMYSTDLASPGIDLFFSKLSYKKGDVITGTFSGYIEKNGGAAYPITNGSFNAIIIN